EDKQQRAAGAMEPIIGTTDEKGEMLLRDVQAGRHSVTGRKDGYIRPTLDLEVTPNHLASSLEIRLRRGPAGRGRVIASARVPVPGAQAVLRPERGERFGRGGA